MDTPRSLRLGFLVAAFLALGLGSCGDSNGADDGARGGAGGPAGGAGGGGGAGRPGPGGSGGGSAGCENASDCPSGSVCDPTTGRCKAGPLACEDSIDCGEGAICSDEGECVANQTGGACASDGDCPSQERCIGGFCGCMGERVEAQQVTPNVMILLDKSGSMDRSAGGSDTKWEIAVRAIENLLVEFEGRIRFGLLVYPEGSGCNVGEIDVEVGLASGPAILDTLARTTPRGSTPIGASLAAVRNYEGIRDPARPNYVLLLTDGDERCNGDGEAEVRALRALDPEVKTFVVGFGSGVSPAELEAMAIAGGTAQSGSTAYFQADDEASLNAAFSTIGGLVLSCAYEIDDTGLALEADDIFVYFDGVPVEHDGGARWSYTRGAGEIVFHGEACEDLRRGRVRDLVIVHGCPVPLD